MEDFNIRGFYGKKISQNLQEDFIVKDFLRKKLSEALVANIEIERSAGRLNIVVETAKPGLIIGRGGGGVELLKKEIERKIAGFKKNENSGVAAKTIKIDIKEIRNPWASAVLVAQMAAQQIEKRMPFRQVMKKSIERVMQDKGVKGIKIEVSGRLNGIEIARKEWLKQGRMPLQTIRADIDYGFTEAHCSYGAIGVKAWLYKGDKFE